MMSSRTAFEGLVRQVTASIAGCPLDRDLEDHLARTFPPGENVFDGIERACRRGVEEGWMCDRETGGIRFGRVVKPAPDFHGFSVDVVEMDDLAGPHHRHPNGEIDMIMPIDAGASFDGRGRGWLVYGPDTAHRPTVGGGKALVLYLLPEGAIEFTKS